MRAFPLTTLNGGINRLQVKGGASAKNLYDLQNAYITQAGSVQPREGTIRDQTLTSQTVGLMAENGVFNVFSANAGLIAPLVSTVLTSATGGTLSSATRYYVVTAFNTFGETTRSNEVISTTSGATSTALISWLSVPGATSYKVYRGTAAAGENVFLTSGNVLSYIDTGSAGSAGSPPGANGTTITVPAGYNLNLLVNPVLTSLSLIKIWFAKPFMGFPYVVAEFSDHSIYDYWLQNNGVWTSSTVYSTGNIVLPTPTNGLAYQAVRDFPAQPTWVPETLTLLNTFVEPTQYTGFAYKAVAVTGVNSSLSLLLHFDGNGGATITTDSSNNNFQFGFAGTAVISTSRAKFGPTSLLVPGSSSGFISTLLTTGGPLDLSTGDFTIECWLNPLGILASLQPAVSALTTAQSGGYSLSLAATNGRPIFNFSTASITHFSTATATTWTAIAMVRHGNVFDIYVNGVPSNAAFTLPGSIGGCNPILYVGASPNFAAGAFDGWIDEVRITKGAALYTTTYTPVSTAFPNPSVSVAPAHTGPTEPVWPTVLGGTIQEFGDFDTSVTDAGTTQGTSAVTTGSQPLGSNITDRYGNSATISNSGASSSTATITVPASTKVTTWQPGTNYAPGSVVQPSNRQGAFINAIPNGDFEAGNDGNWTLDAQWTITNSAPLPAYQGVFQLQVNQNTLSAGGNRAVMTNFGTVTPGQSVTASAYLNPNNNGADLDLWVTLRWYDSSDTFISETLSAAATGGGYRKVSVTDIAPASAAHCRVAIRAGSGTTHRNFGFADLVTWNLEQPVSISNFLFEAVQPSAGSSGQVEPVWPTAANATVLDNQVTWKAVGTSIITWQAIPLMYSGVTQPTFPTTIGASALDPSTFTDVNGVAIATTMSWVAIDRHVTVPNPGKAVALGASHVFNGDNDIVDFSAAVDPTDWTSPNNAGYLPTGLNNYGDNPITVLALYRSNLMAFNAGGYQMWQIDPDPQNMALLDAQPVGSIYPQAAQSVANDLLFLTEVGVRNLSTIGATANMAIGDTGQKVDPIVKAMLTTGTYLPLSLYYPGRGQYWLIFGPYAIVLTMNGTNQKSWARYTFPDTITDWTLNAGILYLRTGGNLVWKLDAGTIGIDDANTTIATASPVAFNGVMQWPYVDAGAFGQNKMMVGVDIVGEGAVSIQVAFNQSDKSTFNDNPGFSTSTGVTTPYLVTVDDTLPGEPLPLPINAPSYSLILTFPGSITTANNWSWEACNLYLSDQSGGGATG